MTDNKKELNIEFSDKFTSTDFEYYIENYFYNCFYYPKINFNLQQIEWISLEEITFLFGWIRYIKLTHPSLKSIKVNLPKFTPQADNDIDKRKNQRLLNLWNVWKIWEKCELDVSTETNFSSENNKYVKDVYQNDTHWHHIVPFTHLNSQNITDFNDIREKVEKNIYNRFDLTRHVEQILERYSSLTPFENKTLSGIFTTELYLNSILHAFSKEADYNECFFAVAFRNKINIQDYKQKKEERGEFLTEEQVGRRVDYILEQNLKERNKDENLFFADFNKKNLALNESYLEFTFLDFGVGIPNKLNEQYQKADINEMHLSKKHYEKKKNGDFIINKDSRILEYAFQLDTSSNPFDKRLEINDYIPRGLFFLVDIVRRYNGLLVVRSGKGKVIFNFKNTKKINESVNFSEEDSKLTFFQGTLFSIYLPARSEKELLYSKMEINLEDNYKRENKDNKAIVEYININEIVKINRALENGNGLINIYNRTFQMLNDKVDSFKYKCTIYVDFSGTEDIEVINRKLYFYLCYTPRFNANSKIIIVHPSNIGELYQAKQAIRYSKLPIYRPIPCFLSNDKRTIQIVWLGITEKQDEDLLNSSILSKTSKSYNIDKFINKESLIGNVISIDESEFVKINIENVSNILEYYSSEFIYNEIPKRFLKQYLEKSERVSSQPNIIQENESFIYWTAGGYYQEKFISFIDLLYSYETTKIGNRGETTDERFGERVARYLIEKYNFNNGTPLEIDYIVSVTLSSQLLGKHIKDMYHRLIYNESGDKKSPKLVRLTNYHEFSIEKAFIRLEEHKKVLIVNDVISTGKLSFELYKKLTELKKAKIVAIFTLIDSREKGSSEVQNYSPPDLKDLTYKLIDFPIQKFRTKQNLIKDGNRQIISIDPVINAPSMMKLERSMGENILYFENVNDENENGEKGNEKKGNKEFLDYFTNPEHLWVGHFHHNLTHHSYYFKTHEILLSGKGDKLLKEIFDFVINKEFSENKINYVFYPMFSAIETLTNSRFRNILKEYPNFHIFPLPRIDTPKGWRFTFPPKLLNAKGWNFTERNVVIIDDGSCSGDTMLQMIDSIAMIEVEKIVVISIIARLEDFRREFFSRLHSIKGFMKYEKHRFRKTDTWESLSAKYGIPVDTLRKHNKANIKTDDIIGIPLSKNKAKEIPLSIYFGAHFHIPVYSPSKHCPFCYEKDILNEELKSSIAPPDSVKGYIKNRIKELALFDTDGTPMDENSHSYSGIPNNFPKNFDIKKLFLARDTIGKIDTYRLYKNYIKDSYDKIEIDYYLGVIIHEPRLVVSISHLLPHLKIRLLNSVKSGIGLSDYPTNVELILKWDKVQLIKALYLLNEDVLYVFKYLKIISSNIAPEDIDSINFLVYIFWKKLKQNDEVEKYKNLVNRLLNELPDNSSIRKIWGQFVIWVIDRQRYTYKDGYSFEYLKDFYTKKDVEYPNHLTLGYEFLSLHRKIRGLKQLIDTTPIESVPDEKFSNLKKLSDQAISKIRKPFLEIIKDNGFKEIIGIFGFKDKFYSDETSAEKLLDEVQSFFKSPMSRENIENVLNSLKKFIEIYLNPRSEFGKFFLKHEISILNVYNTITEEFEKELINTKISFRDEINLKEDIQARIHQDCFELIISEFFRNCMKHTIEIRKLKHNTLESDAFIEIHNNSDFIYITYTHQLNYSNKKELTNGGLSKAKTIAQYFGGDFNIENKPKKFKVNISLPIVKTEYNFKNQGHE